MVVQDDLAGASDFGFRADLRREMLASERTRAVIGLGLTVFLFLILVGLTVFGAGPVDILASRPQLAWSLTGLLAAAIIFFLSYRYVVGKRVETGQPLAAVWRYVTACFEILLPTVAVILDARVFGPTFALMGPPAVLFPLMILLSIFGLEWKVCVFSGAVTALVWMGLFSWFAPEIAAEYPDTLFAAPQQYFEKAILWFGMGVLCAVAAREWRRRAERSLRAARDRDRIRALFGRHVSPLVVDTLMDRAAPLTAESRHICVMFLDIRGFTAWSSAHSPATTVAYLNALFGPLATCIEQRGGIINKFLGDGFMAIFGAPLDDLEPEIHAAAAAIDCLATVERLVKEEAIAPTRIGIGLHAGPAVCGSIGSLTRQEYTAIGTTVNLAARIESLNKQYDSQILASRAVAARLPLENRGTDLGEIAVRGHPEPIALFQLA
ncbi:MAG: adenylate/guanylate cyclase domain-containing protein [Myxococcales bacterium]|nr:adenylate/guanylate cyclase domain-containing protein [Myxococcales bacterium]